MPATARRNTAAIEPPCATAPRGRARSSRRRSEERRHVERSLKTKPAPRVAVLGSRPALRTSSVLEALEPSPFSRPPRCRWRVNLGRRTHSASSVPPFARPHSVTLLAAAAGFIRSVGEDYRNPSDACAFRSRKEGGASESEVLLFLARTAGNGRAGSRITRDPGPARVIVSREIGRGRRRPGLFLLAASAAERKNQACARPFEC